MAENQWAEELVSNVASEVKRRRTEQKISVRALSERTREIGYPISESVLTNFELGRRGTRLDVVELLILALALDVPPVLLLYPGYPDSNVHVWPGGEALAYQAANWVSGDYTAHYMHNGASKLTDDQHTLVRLTRERSSLYKLLLTGLKNTGNFDPIAVISEMEEKRDSLNTAIEQAGGVVRDTAEREEDNADGQG